MGTDHETITFVTHWYCSPAARSWSIDPVHSRAHEFHRSLPGYGPTPLVDLPRIAAELSVARVLLKDESARLGLPAFKILGASWACRQVLERSPGARLVTATDGNHGRAVARMAAHFGVAASVFVPEVMLPATAELIASEGAQVVRVAGDYDFAVRRAAEFADAQPGRALVQDTAWEGYTEVPGWIVEGYQTLLHEIDEALTRPPDLVVVPVGVGSLAEAVLRHYRRRGVPHPSVLSVEPDTAACLLASLTAGHPVVVPTAATVMAGLNCGTVSAGAWPVLWSGCDAAVSVSDEAAMTASADLDTLGVSSGPCGAASLAGARAVARDPARRADIGLGSDSVVVLISTEGHSG